MIRGAFPDADERSPTALHRAYCERLASTVDSVGVDRVADATAVDPATLRALGDDSPPEIDLSTAAAILATAPDARSADDIEAEALDILLMGMTRAVLDVERLAAGLELSVDPKRLQQQVEGRHPFALREYAHVHAHLAEQVA